MTKTENAKSDIQNYVKGSKLGPFEFKTKPEYVYSTVIIVGYVIFIYGLFTFPYSLAKKTILLSEYCKSNFKEKYKNLPL